MQASSRLKPAFMPSHARVAVLVALAALLTLLSPASLYAVPLGAASSLASAVNAVTEEQLTVPVRAEADGIPTSLEVVVWRPDGGGQHPAVLLAHGFGGSVADLREQGRKLAERGYVAVGYSARGFGASGGRIHLNDPEFEIADARAGERGVQGLVSPSRSQRGRGGIPSGQTGRTTRVKAAQSGAVLPGASLLVRPPGVSHLVGSPGVSRLVGSPGVSRLRATRRSGPEPSPSQRSAPPTVP